MKIYPRYDKYIKDTIENIIIRPKCFYNSNPPATSLFDNT